MKSLYCEDGIDEAAWSRAMTGHKPGHKPARLTQHSILLERAQAVVEQNPTRVALCDIALGRQPDLSALPSADAARLGWLGRREATDELAGRCP